MKTKENAIKLLTEKEGNAKLVETQGIYECSVSGKYYWGIFHNGIGVRWYAIHKLGKKTHVHIFTEYEKVIEYIKGKII